MNTRPSRLDKEAVLKVGSVSAVTGRRIFVAVDRDKNLSELFYDGDVLRNIAVGSYIDIRKGFMSLIGKVEGENAQEDGSEKAAQLIRARGRRILTVSLVGFLNHEGKFFGGTKELPLVGNEAFLLTKEKLHQVHDLISKDGIALDIALSEYEGYEIAFPVDGLMNSHIAVFGNTGSGKSNTLAILFQEFIKKMRLRNTAAFEERCRIILFDFNGECVGPECLTPHKKVYRLSTRDDHGDKLPLAPDGFLDLEILSILADATEKTQKPFLRRALAQYAIRAFYFHYGEQIDIRFPNHQVVSDVLFRPSSPAVAAFYPCDFLASSLRMHHPSTAELQGDHGLKKVLWSVRKPIVRDEMIFVERMFGRLTDGNF